MAEYIEKTQLLEKLKHRVSTDDDSKFATGFIKGTNEALGIIEEWIASIPAADVAPVVHGRWLNFYNDFSCAECDRCGTTFEVTDSESNEGLWNAFKLSYNYCPNCGAKMDGED